MGRPAYLSVTRFSTVWPSDSDPNWTLPGSKTMSLRMKALIFSVTLATTGPRPRSCGRKLSETLIVDSLKPLKCRVSNWATISAVSYIFTTFLVVLSFVHPHELLTLPISMSSTKTFSNTKWCSAVAPAATVPKSWISFSLSPKNCVAHFGAVPSWHRAGELLSQIARSGKRKIFRNKVIRPPCKSSPSIPNSAYRVN